MSNESSASETTPLRRPESQNSEDVSSLSSPKRGVNNNNSANITRPTIATAASTAVANYNNNIEVCLGHRINNINNNNSEINMDTNKRILCRVGLDVIILMCVGFPILFFFLWGDSYKRGFFCDDESLKHPFKNSTIRSWMLYIIGLVIPCGVIISVEIIKSKQNAKRSNSNAAARHYAFMGYDIPDWMVECYKKIGIFGFGVALSQLTTDIAKYSIGRLRPHFFTVCQPIMPDGSTCDNPINAGKYILNFECRGEGATARMLKESRLSFPSGHSSFAFYTMVYLAFYLQSRMTWRGSKLFRHFLQFLFIMIAWYTALSRVSDYKHHWSDVLAGSTIGVLCALIVANYVSDLFQEKSTKSYMLPRTSQDTAPQTIINGH